MIVSNVKPLMKNRKMTMRRLAQVTGLSYDTISRARGPLISRCTLDTLESIAQALGVEVGSLYERAAQPAPPQLARAGERV